MPGATTASDVSFAAAIPRKLVMMPQTVPNRPTNGDTEEITARPPRPFWLSTPEQKSLSEAAESVGCAGVKFRH